MSGGDNRSHIYKGEPLFRKQRLQASKLKSEEQITLDQMRLSRQIGRDILETYCPDAEMSDIDALELIIMAREGRAAIEDDETFGRNQDIKTQMDILDAGGTILMVYLGRIVRMTADPLNAAVIAPDGGTGTLD